MERQRLNAVDVFAPWADQQERELRLRIHRAQTTALKRAAVERNGTARALYYEASALAARWVFTRVRDVECLERVLWALSQIFMACSHIVIVEAPDEA